jgi:hypothetical protein
MDDDSVVTFADLVKCWDGRLATLEGGPAAAVRARRQRFVVIADSCFSGALVEQLRNLPAREREGLGMAVQAACRSDEVSCGGVFTESFALRQATPPRNFQWARLAQKLGYRCTEELQHPVYYSTWREPKVAVDGVHLRFYKRA